MLATTTPAAVPGGPRPGLIRARFAKTIDQQWPDPDRTGLPGPTMPHGARAPGAGKADCESRPYQSTHDETPRTPGAERQPEAFQGFTPTQSRASDPAARSSPGANPIADAILGAAVTRRPGTKSCPRRAAARQRPAAVAFASRENIASTGLPRAAKARSVIERR
jgi:hypothetical protein